MPGFSLTLLLLPREEDSSPSPTQVLSLLDSKPDVPAWPWTSSRPPLPLASQMIQGGKVQVSRSDMVQLKAKDAHSFVKAIRQAAEALIVAEPDITKMDSIAGDGDCGLTLKVSSLMLKKL